MRSSLRPLLKLERQSGTLNYSPYSLDFDEECSQIKIYFAEAKQVIVSLSGDNFQNKIYSVQSRLGHLHSRVMRMPLSILTAEQKTIKSALLIDVLATLDSLDEACKSDPELSRLMSPRENNESVNGEDSSSQWNIGDHDAPEQNFLQSSFYQDPISAKFQSIEK